MRWSEILHDMIGHGGREILWWQMSIRAVVVMLFGLVLIRVFGRRAFGKQTPLDIVIAIVIGSNLSRTLTGSAPFVPTLAATATIVILFWIVSQLAARWGWLTRCVKGEPSWLVRDGKPDPRTMRRFGVSKGDIAEAARKTGIKPARVDEAVLERSGKISTVPRD